MEDLNENNGTSLTSGRRLLRNVIWNGAGEVGPLIAAFIAMPILIHQLGIERFGVLALAWTVFGYFTLFDLGVGSALTKFASQFLAERRETEIPELFWTSICLLAGLGVFGALILAFICPLLVHHILKIPLPLQGETIDAFYLMALGLSMGISTGGLGAMLAAYQRFDLINLVRSPNAIISSIGPILVLPFSHSIAVIVGVLVLNQFATLVAYSILLRHAAPGLLSEFRAKPALVKGLLSFGGWETASNLLIGSGSTVDRFLLAAITSIGAVSFYVVPSRILNKLRLIPWFVTWVLYPAFAHSLAEDRERARMLFDRGVKLIALSLFPIVLVAVVFSRELLTLWMGASFAGHATVVLQLFALSVLADGIGWVGATLVSAAHRPDINAKIHGALLIPGLGLTLVMIKWYGADGAAAACLVRTVVDSIAHWVTARTVLPSASLLDARLGCFLLAAVSSMAIAVLPLDLEAKVLAVAAIIAGIYSAAWFMLLNESDRSVIQGYLRDLRAPAKVKIAQAVD
jgi:O-antigen/teichoic acid export membrane protein